ncbi:hypothetical protein [Flavobacterium sp. IMCC34518]|uniref:hypothetical protein n=1 Tax=Flavobacterium sp. IMCC34518 TaxID=3003623 RepID=UPI0022AC2D78|nr:hypothetical protein [Flavobacterium sp. IMCC34518]
MPYTKIIPAINQIETNVFVQENILYPLLKGSAIQMETCPALSTDRSRIFSPKHWLQSEKKQITLPRYA